MKQKEKDKIWFPVAIITTHDGESIIVERPLVLYEKETAIAHKETLEQEVNKAMGVVCAEIIKQNKRAHIRITYDVRTNPEDMMKSYR